MVIVVLAFFSTFFTVFVTVFFGSSSLWDASGTHFARISACSVRANSLYEVLPGVLRLVDRFFTVFYVPGPFFYRFFTVFV